ncbi:MAG TPA: helix-turn-helix domain-containing protein, partial [Roseiflexaceae bacterium]|nr:helix-turn-helix domain-containing protein [Roseiflexaceae bacterium]
MSKEKLTRRQQEVLAAFQLNPTATLREVAEQMDVTHERIRQVVAELVARGLIRKPSEVRRDEVRRNIQIVSSRLLRLKFMQAQLKRRRRRYVLREKARLAMDGVTSNYLMPGPESVCMFEGCHRPVRARGYCNSHYTRLRETGALWVQRYTDAKCAECGEPAYARGLCSNHYAKAMRRNDWQPTQASKTQAKPAPRKQSLYPRIE